jgi:hypothetical protein
MTDQVEGEEAKHEHDYFIFVDGAKVYFETDEVTGAQIKQRAGKPDNYQLFLEQPGRPDKLIQDQELVKIHNGQHYHTVPPATFG